MIGKVAVSSTPSTNIANTPVDSMMIDGLTVNKSDIISMRKKIDDMSEVCLVREKSILDVSCGAKLYQSYPV